MVADYGLIAWPSQTGIEAGAHDGAQAMRAMQQRAVGLARMAVGEFHRVAPH